MTPLHFAAGMNSRHVTMTLMEDQETRIDIQNEGGNTPLHIVRLSGNDTLASIIIQSASSKDLARVIGMQNNNGKTPQKIAEQEYPDLHAAMMADVK